MNQDKIHVITRAVVLDGSYILLCKTTDLKNNFYYLPGGHIEHGETAEVAILREMLEETGARSSVKRFLGCLEYKFDPGYNSICHNHEYNIVFEIVSGELSVNTPLKKLEDKLDLHWLHISKLKDIDFRASPLKELVPKWLALEENGTFKSVDDTKS
jgi:8-oxo-dGTP pyrophosphatase MutT (NUDIX family)